VSFFNLVFVFCIVTTNFYFYFLLVNFADQPLGIRQTILKEWIRSAAVRKEERESRYILRRINNGNNNNNINPYAIYRLNLLGNAVSESSICQHGFRNVYGIFKHSWASLKKAAMISDPGPLKHGNLRKRNRYSGSIVAAMEAEVVAFLEELGRTEGESYATRFIRERTSILIRKDEEDLIELPSSYTKRRIYER
jgi:hypothetical protein